MAENEKLVAAALEGNYQRVTELAAALAPGAEPQLEQFRIQMEEYEAAVQQSDWRRALRALADARLAAIGAGIPDLEAIATQRLYSVVKQYEGRRES
ncbi:MAG: hypothetical protein ACM3XM_05980 [Mycobacterium leprae]